MTSRRSLVTTGASMAAIVAVMFGARALGDQLPRRASPACDYPMTVQTVEFSAARYPNIHQHYLDAVAKGWPRILVLDRTGDATRRSKLLAPVPTHAGQDRDEYPPATAREGWLADVEYVPSGENRSQGASLGAQLRGLCDGVRFEYRWRP